MDLFWRVLSDTLGRFGGWIERAGPSLLVTLLVLVLGWFTAKIVQVGVARFMRVLKLDVLAERGGVSAFLSRGGVTSTASEILGKLVYWILLLLTLLVAVSVLGISEARFIFSSVAVIVPRVIVALVIVILGLSVAGIVANTVETAATNAQVAAPRLLAAFCRWTITIFVSIVALNELDVSTEVINSALLILFASVCLALALAFGLGCRDLAGRIAEEIYQREKARAAKVKAHTGEPEAGHGD